MTIQVDFQVDQMLLVGRLWDVSASGAYILFMIHKLIASELSGFVTIQHSSFGDPFRLRSRFLEFIYCELTFLQVLMRRSASVTPLGGITDLRLGTGLGRFD